MMNDISEAELFAEWTARERNAFFSSLSRQEQQEFFYRWHFWARPGQRPPAGDWSIWLIMAGRGFGKTRAGAEWVRQIAEGDGSARFALVGETDFSNPDSISPAALDAWQKDGALEVWGWRENMRDVYAQASIVCLPSYREGLSRTLLEAAASARPIVTSDAPGCREIVRPGENGLLAPVGDSDALAAALDELLRQPENWQKFGLAGRRRVAENFSLEKILAQTLDVYEE